MHLHIKFSSIRQISTEKDFPKSRIPQKILHLYKRRSNFLFWKRRKKKIYDIPNNLAIPNGVISLQMPSCTGNYVYFLQRHHVQKIRKQDKIWRIFWKEKTHFHPHNDYRRWVAKNNFSLKSEIRICFERREAYIIVERKQLLPNPSRPHLFKDKKWNWGGRSVSENPRVHRVIVENGFIWEVRELSLSKKSVLELLKHFNKSALCDDAFVSFLEVWLFTVNKPHYSVFVWLNCVAQLTCTPWEHGLESGQWGLGWIDDWDWRCHL